MKEELSVKTSPIQYNIGTYFILPLRCQIDKLTSVGTHEWVGKVEACGWRRYVWEYSDYYTHINRLFSMDGGNKSIYNSKGVVGIEFEKKVCMLAGTCVDTRVNAQFSIKGSEGFELYFRSFRFIATHSGIGFLVIGIESKNPQTIKRIRKEGYNYNDACCFESFEGQHCTASFSIVELITSLLSNTGFTDYAEELTGEKNARRLFRDATVYSVGIIKDDTLRKKGFTTSELRKLCLDLRYAKTIGNNEKYESTDLKSFSTFASPNSNGNIRWMTYSIFQHTVQIMKSANLSERIIGNVDENYLPFIIISLYIRYSCMYFSELLGTHLTKNKRMRYWMEEQMIRMKAFGVIEPSEMTPYSNLNHFYEGQQEIYGLKEATASITDKIALLQNIRNRWLERTESIITIFISVFGVFSIVSDIMAITENYNRYGLHGRIYTIAGVLALSVFVVFAFVRSFIKSRWKDKW